MSHTRPSVGVGPAAAPGSGSPRGVGAAAPPRHHPLVSVSPASTRGWTFEQDLAFYERVGIRRASLDGAKLAAGGVELAEATRRVRDAGLTIDLVYQPARFVLTEPRGWPALRERLIEILAALEPLGALGLYVTPGAGRGLAYEDAAAAFGDAIAPVMDAARELDATVVLEATRPQFADWSFVHTFADSVRLAAAHGMQVALDTAHCWWEPGLERALEEQAAQVAFVQLADLWLDRPVTERAVPGDGQLPLRRLLAPLFRGGFAGPIELELLGPAIEAEGYERALERGMAYASALLDDLAETAR